MASTASASKPTGLVLYSVDHAFDLCSKLSTGGNDIVCETQAGMPVMTDYALSSA